MSILAHRGVCANRMNFLAQYISGLPDDEQRQIQTTSSVATQNVLGKRKSCRHDASAGESTAKRQKTRELDRITTNLYANASDDGNASSMRGKRFGTSVSGTQFKIHDASIHSLIYPRDRAAFSGWAKMKMIDRRGTVHLVAGNIPCIDPYYTYTLVCEPPLDKSEKKKKKDGRSATTAASSDSTDEATFIKEQKSKKKKERFTRKREGGRGGKWVSQYDAPNRIIRIESVERKPLTRGVLASMLFENGVCDSEIEADCVANETVQDLTLECIQQQPWFETLLEKTSYFFGEDFVYLMECYGGDGKKKKYSECFLGMKPSVFQHVVEYARKEPWKLCCKALRDPALVPDTVSEMSFEGMERCMQRYEIVKTPEIEDIMRSVRLYKEKLKPYCKKAGHTYMTQEDMDEAEIPFTVQEWLVQHGALVYDMEKNVYYLQKSVAERKAILEKLDAVFYQHGHWLIEAETVFKEKRDKLGRLRRYVDREATLNRKRYPFRYDLYKEWLASEDREALNAQQRHAVDMSFCSALLVVVGGPGCGKTHTVKSIVRAHHPSTYLILGPTGIASNKLRMETGRGRTIDLTLTEMRNMNKRREELAQYKGLIVDEVSMTTEKQYAQLLPRLTNLEQIILIGDPDQTKPIGRGFPLKDFLRKYEDDYPNVVVRLTENHRVDKSSQMILSCLQRIRERSDDIECGYDIEDKESSVVMLHRPDIATFDDPKNERDDPECDGAWKALEKVLDYYDSDSDGHAKIQILTHKNETADRMNRRYFKKYSKLTPKEAREYEKERKNNPNKRLFHRGQRVVITKNNYGVSKKLSGIVSDHVENGEVDYIENVFYYIPYTSKNASSKRSPIKDDAEHEFFKVEEMKHSLSQRPSGNSWRLAFRMRDSRKVIDIGVLGIENIKHGVAITGNKSQSQEYSILVVLFDPNVYVSEHTGGITRAVSKYFSPSLLYTIVSRAKQRVIVICDTQTPEGYKNGEFGYLIREHQDSIRNHDLDEYLPDPPPVLTNKDAVREIELERSRREFMNACGGLF